jgi:hypothetical protein
MSTSGTVGQTVIDVQTLIDHGARRAGKMAGELTDEQILSAKESLFYLLSNLANIGIQYWCIDKTVIGYNVDQYVYNMPVGTVDILNANYRTLTRVSTSPTSSSGTAANAFDGNTTTICTLSTNTGWIAINNGSGNPFYLGTVGILPGVSGSVTAKIEYSNDGSTWATLYDLGTVTWADGTWLYYDITASQTAQYFRLKQSSGTNMAVRELVFGTAPNSIPISRMNRDDYTSLPNRNFQNIRSLLYWFDRTIPQPTIYIWGVPNDAFPQMEIWYHRQIQDVGALSGQLEIPQRWYLAIQSMLAHQMSLELPSVDLARIGYLEQQAEKYLNQAEQEERDKSPIYWAPNISVYSR